MKNIWKSFLYAVLAAILPLIYTLILKAIPDFPLSQNEFVEFLLWAIGYLIGGWQANSFVTALKLKKNGSAKLTGTNIEVYGYKIKKGNYDLKV